MLRSLFSGISGLRAHQQMMDATGNNIANVNTIGYKSSQTVFQDTLSQMVNAAGAPQGDMGGTNPAQAGLGVRLASINANFSQGAAQATGKSSDMMIQGDGFFMVKSGGEQLFTRAGSFTFDANGALTTPNGQMVQGWTANAGVINNSGPPDNIVLPIGVTLSPKETKSMTLTGNFSYEAPDAAEKIISIKMYDSNGTPSTVPLTFTRSTDPSPQTVPPAVPFWTMTGTMPDGTAVSQVVNFVNGKAISGVNDPETGLDNGIITVADATVPVPPAVQTNYSFDIHDLTQFAGLTEARVSNSDGSASGILASYTVSNTGQIVGQFSNGLKQTLGQLALANFNNVNGLEKIGDSMFRSTVNSGLAQVGSAGSAGLGMISSGSLEMSNVDLAQEFTNLVIAQRGFQANSRVITTSDEILQELVNLKR